MMPAVIKICGVRSPQIASVVAEAGADLMGLIFAPSRRQVSTDQARDILYGLHGLDQRPKVVGVFVNETADRINELAELLPLDLVQLSGDEPVEFQQLLERPIIRALRFPAETEIADACRDAERYFDAPSPALALLLDTHVAGVYGGTGQPGDWELARRLSERYPVILAGGLRPETVAEAIKQVGPLGVDVSSGVETDGVKDPDKIRALVATVR
jgi:phosphoribosylanthranilate isomerase